MIISNRVKNIMLLFLVIAVAFICLCMGFLAIKKSMQLSVAFEVQPQIRCEIEMKKSGESDFDIIFSNVTGSEFILDSMVLNEITGTLTLNNTFNGGVGAGFDLRIKNYNDQKIFVDVSGAGVSYNAVAIDKKNGSTISNGVLNVSAVSNNAVIKFLQVEDEYLTSSLVNSQFDLTDENNTLLKCGNNYYVPLGEDFTAKLVSTTPYACPDIITLTINGVSKLSVSGTMINCSYYNTRTQTISIPNNQVKGVGNVALSASIYWDGSQATEFAGGTGISDDPYLIATPRQLALIATAVNSYPSAATFTGYTGNACAQTGGFTCAYYKLLNDMYLNDEAFPTNGDAPTANANGLKQWISIGWHTIDENSRYFYGHINGDYYNIWGLYLNDSSIYANSFVSILSGTMEKLIIQSGYVRGNGYCGGIASHLGGQMSECANYATVISNYAGGLCGVNNAAYAVIKNCYNAGVVIDSVNNLNSGITSWLRCVSGNNLRIENCYSYGSCNYGIYGWGDGDGITNCYYLAGSATSAGGGISKTSAQLQSLANLPGFSSSIWRCVAGVNNGYPIFVGQRL